MAPPILNHNINFPNEMSLAAAQPSSMSVTMTTAAISDDLDFEISEEDLARIDAEVNRQLQAKVYVSNNMQLIILSLLLS